MVSMDEHAVSNLLMSTMTDQSAEISNAKERNRKREIERDTETINEIQSRIRVKWY